MQQNSREHNRKHLGRQTTDERNIFSVSVIIHFHEAIADAAEAQSWPGEIVNSQLLICE